MTMFFHSIQRRCRVAFTAAAGLVASAFLVSACSDMLDSDNSRQLFDRDLNQKTDSMFFAVGIMQCMQQLADQYVFQGEMRGDNVATTTYTDNNLRKLASFSADRTDRYDSAYVYYRVINNCNYYIAHRDTALYTGSTNVVIHEYAAIKAFRAWAYLQLARNYGKVPFFTEPLTSISQINRNDFPKLDIKGIVDKLAPDLEKYTGFNIPTNGTSDHAVGSTNLGQRKTIRTDLCYIPVDVILGELYLEVGDYANAARHYSTYLTSVSKPTGSPYAQAMTENPDFKRGNASAAYPSDLYGWAQGDKWSSIFSNNSIKDIITYIPMAVNRLQGTTTQVPLAFGYNYYATKNTVDEVYEDKIQLEPSTALKTLSDSTEYYYFQNVVGKQPMEMVNALKVGDTRLASVTRRGQGEDSSKVWVTKYNNGNIILYRNTTVYLHLAEALNRLGHPDAAFAILKDGITASLLDSTRTYITDDTRQMLTATYPFLSAEHMALFPTQTNSNTATTNWGIHQHGAGVTGDGNFPGRSPYQYDAVLGKKLAQIGKTFNVTVGATRQDSINAMEDILCDEYQLEFAFEGTRWYDLMRLARHKNDAGLYGADFGGRWLARKLEYKHPAVDLKNPDNWYLPF